MKILVTGAAGFIATNLIPWFLGRGDEVVGIDNFFLGKRAYVKPLIEHARFTFHEHDLLDLDRVASIFADFQPDRVWHLAANSDISYGTKYTDFDLKGGTLVTYNVLESMRRAGVKEIVSPSLEVSVPLSVRQMVTPFVGALVLVAAAVGYALARPEPTEEQFTKTLEEKVRGYEVYRYKGPGLLQPNEPSWVIPAYAENIRRPPERRIDAVSIAYAWLLIWSLAAWMTPRQRPSDSGEASVLSP